MRDADVTITGKVVCICGYGVIGKRCALTMKACGAHVVVTEIDPICALQAFKDGFVIDTLKDIV